MLPAGSNPSAAYDAEIYDSLFSYLLQHRNLINCRINQPFEVNQSVYDGMSKVVSELAAGDRDVEQTIQIVEDRYQPKELELGGRYFLFSIF